MGLNMPSLKLDVTPPYEGPCAIKPGSTSIEEQFCRAMSRDPVLKEKCGNCGSHYRYKPPMRVVRTVVDPEATIPERASKGEFLKKYATSEQSRERLSLQRSIQPSGQTSEGREVPRRNLDHSNHRGKERGDVLLGVDTTTPLGELSFEAFFQKFELMASGARHLALFESSWQDTVKKFNSRVVPGRKDWSKEVNILEVLQAIDTMFNKEKMSKTVVAEHLNRGVPWLEQVCGLARLLPLVRGLLHSRVQEPWRLRLAEGILLSSIETSKQMKEAARLVFERARKQLEREFK